MTHAAVFRRRSDGGIVGFQTEGHAGYAEKGSDIVCAAVSMLVINTINAIELYTTDDCAVQVSEADAFISLRVRSVTQSRELQVLLKALALGLSQAAQDHPEYLTFTIEEV